MRNLVLALLLIATASTAFAGPIIDIQTGMYPEDTLVYFDGVVTAVRDNGFFVGEYAPAPYAGIWVYTGTGNHSLVVG